jgi:hypothetical protein
MESLDSTDKTIREVDRAVMQAVVAWSMDVSVGN